MSIMFFALVFLNDFIARRIYHIISDVEMMSLYFLLLYFKNY